MLELEKRKVSKMSQLHWRYFGWGGGWYFESVDGAVGFYRCPYAFWCQGCLKEGGGVSTTSRLSWRYFGWGGGLMFFECVGGVEELYQRLYTFFGSEDVLSDEIL